MVALFFYLFAGLAIFSAAMVVFSKNPVYSVLFLIMAFVNASGLFLLLGAEFLSVLFVIVYVGAVAVLFLFVVMMLDIDLVRIRQGVLSYLPVGMGVGGLLLVELLVAFGALSGKTMPPSVSGAPENVRSIGHVLYTDYVLLFQISGLILLLAMVGAIVLTLRHKAHVKRQSIEEQVFRGREGVRVRKVGFHAGVRGDDVHGGQ